MSAPTPAPGDESPREGYYPDPSIPGYVRYWNGASWVPGTSRPAPQGGTAPAQPATGQPAGPAPAARRPAPVEETGPVYFDEADEDGGAAPDRAEPGGRPEPATAWQADTSRQTGFGGERDRRVSWGGAGSDPRVGGPAEGAGPAPADPRLPAAAGPAGGAVPAMRDGGDDGPREGGREDRNGGGREGDAQDGTVTIRAVGRGGAPRAPRTREEGPAAADGTLTIRAHRPGPDAPANTRPPGTAAPAPAQAPAPAAQPPAASHRPALPAQGRPPVAPQPLPGTSQPLGPVAGQGASWAQQVHQLARPEQPVHPQQAGPVPVRQPSPQQEQQQPVTPWKPPVDDPFQQLARAQASARPAGLGKRLAARILDSVVLGALVGAVGFPLATRALEHIDRKIEAAERTGETVTVWLLDSTTAGLLGAVIGAFLVLGFLLEALPTAKWGRTLGKKLCGLDVRDIESHDAPGLKAAVRRWLVYGVLGLLVVGVVNVLWCLIDRPWRQCWHDKAARTFVAG
ncbi:RDD family protein [Streptomyces nitrosporeus]|uniref:RDD family protein n=1 Tax=Streptomyces nitrosporeus TaxID=28894 RepID=UPI00331D1C7E